VGVQVVSASGKESTLAPINARAETIATVEAIFNLGTLGRNDTSAAPMSDMFRGGIP